VFSFVQNMTKSWRHYRLHLNKPFAILVNVCVVIVMTKIFFLNLH